MCRSNFRLAAFLNVRLCMWQAPRHLHCSRSLEVRLECMLSLQAVALHARPW